MQASQPQSACRFESGFYGERQEQTDQSQQVEPEAPVNFLVSIRLVLEAQRENPLLPLFLLQVLISDVIVASDASGRQVLCKIGGSGEVLFLRFFLQT